MVEETVLSGRKCDRDAPGVACAVVVYVYHFGISFLSGPRRAGVVSLLEGQLYGLLGSGPSMGSLAVEPFFMLSGALASRTLDDGGFSALRYLLHKARCLPPPLWLAWLVACVWVMA